MKILLALLCLGFSHATLAATLPQGMNASEREQTAELVASSSALRSAQLHRSLDHSEGLDLSLSFENLPLSQLPIMGVGAERLEDQNFIRLQVGTGLIRSVDLALFLTPLNPSTPLSNYGGRIRWTFYQDAESPLFLAVFIDGGNTNLSDQVLMQTVAAGTQVGFKRKQLSLSFFLGSQLTFSRFRGGGEGITDSGHPESYTFTSFPMALGGVYDFRKWYLGFGVDRQSDTLISAKIGKVF